MRAESVGELLLWQPTNNKEVIKHGILPRGAVMFVFGDQGTFKSWLMKQLAWSASAGEAWLGMPTEESGSRVLLLNTEIPQPAYP